MYCCKCGVELQSGVEKCPLCGLPVYHPEISEQPEPAPYPRYSEETVSHSGLLFILSVLFLIPLAICLIVDLALDGQITWSGYVVFGLLTAYVILCLPLWFRSPDPVIFFPVDMAAILGLTLYICLKTGGSWFLPFALPVGGTLMVILETEITLLRHTVRGQRHRALYILGGGVMALGGLCVLIEFLLHVSFALPMLWWSLYPLTVLLLLGAMLLVIGLCPPLRRSLHKRFFI